MQVDAEDLGRLSHEIRRFLNKGDLLSRLSTMATLYLEFADVGTMRHAHLSIMAALPPGMIGANGVMPYEYIDDHTIRMEPFAGVTFVLSCKQRFATRMHGSVGYRDIAFVDAKLPKNKP